MLVKVERVKMVVVCQSAVQMEYFRKDLIIQKYFADCLTDVQRQLMTG